jgi:hypothetical protein
MMARGWDSKSVEDQIAEAGRKPAPPLSPRSPEDLRRGQERHALRLALARVQTDLAHATHERHRGMLAAAAADLERRLVALDKIKE